MNRDHFLFLLGGLAFGVLIGFGSYHAIHTAPVLDAATPESSGLSMSGSNPSASPPAGAPMVKRINQLKRTLQEEPDNVAALLELGNVYYDVSMWEQAADYYERAVAQEPNPNLLTDLGVCYREMKEFDRALAMFARANELDPAHWQSLYNTLVVAAFDVARFDLAERAIDAMEAIDPRPPELAQIPLAELRTKVRNLASGAEGSS